MRILALPAFKNRRENPYTAMLYDALRKRADVTVEEFSDQRLLFRRWDILHLHWPDAPLHKGSAAAAAAHGVLLILRVLWARLLGARIVWTVHNLRSHHAAHPRIEGWLWKMFVPLVHACIHLSADGRRLALQTWPGLAGKVHAIVPHGHYREAYPNYSFRSDARELLGIPADAPVAGFIGQIKAYKNVPGLVRAFLEAAHPRAMLLIAGRPGDAAIEKELRELIGADPRVICRFGLIPDDRMHLYLNACDLTVFPYRDILNSGSAILALSFDRPALVPARGAMAELRELAGPDWVYTYDGELTGQILRDAIERATAPGRPQECDLAALDWDNLAAFTLNAYLAALGRPTAQPHTKTALA
jgi:glycosyltransferase involved in cell wall biosynthesis